jgi:purine-binding chemotaxis protein CheW
MPDAAIAKAKGRFDWAQAHLRQRQLREATEHGITPGAEDRARILRMRAGALAATRQRPQVAPDSVIEVAEFLLGNERYGIAVNHIAEISALVDLTPLPCTPAFVLGLINLRGQILPVINLKKMFDLPEKGLTDLNKVVVLRSQGAELGILADAITGVRSIFVEDLRPALPTLTGIRAEYLRGVTDDSLVILDAGRILGDEKLRVQGAESVAS